MTDEPTSNDAGPLLDPWGGPDEPDPDHDPEAYEQAAVDFEMSQLTPAEAMAYMASHKGADGFLHPDRPWSYYERKIWLGDV